MASPWNKKMTYSQDKTINVPFANTAIGAFKEKVDNLANAIKYLDKWKQ